MCRSPLLPLLARDLGASPALVGFIVGASTLTGVVVKLPAGALSDALGRRRLLLGASVVFALLPFGYFGAATLAALVVLRFAHGTATAVFGPVASAAISDLAPADRRGVWLGIYSTLQGAGQSIGPLLVGYLLATGGYRSAFAISGLLGLCALGLVAGWPPDRSPHAVDALWPRVRQGVREVAADARILTTSLAQAGQFLLNGALGGFLPLHAKEVVGLGTPEIGALVALQTVVTLSMRPLFGALSDRFGRRRLIAGGLSVCGLAVWGVAQAGGLVALALAIAAYGAGLAVTTSATSAYVTDLSKRSRYGAAHGIFGTIYDIGDAAGPIAAGLLVAALGYRGMFEGLAVAAIVIAASFAWGSRRWD